MPLAIYVNTLLTAEHNSAKELEHYERVRKTFDSFGEPQNKSAEASSGRPVTAEESSLPSRPNFKDRPGSKGKGKGKAAVRDWGAFAVDEPGDDEGENVANSRHSTNGHKSLNGWGIGKRAVPNLETDGFGDASANDEQELYG